MAIRILHEIGILHNFIPMKWGEIRTNVLGGDAV